MITRFAAQGYKSLRSVDVPLNWVTVVLGPNTVGKSNLFDAIDLLARVVTSRDLNEAFDGHRGTPHEAFSFPEGGLATLMKGDENPSLVLQCDVRLSDAVVERVNAQIQNARTGLKPGQRGRHYVVEKHLRYRIEIEIVPRTGMLRVKDEYLCALRADGKERQSRKPFISLVDDVLRLRMEGSGRPNEHDVGLTYALVSQPVYAPHAPHIAALREELANWRFFYLEPEAMRAETPVAEVTTLRRDGRDLAAVLHTLRSRDPERFAAIVRAARLLLPGISDIRTEATEEGLVRLEVVESGVPFSARVISEGTLRLFALLTLVSVQGPTVIGYEEPENGVHPRRLELIARLIENAGNRHETQFLVNTHSVLLPDAFRESDTLLLSAHKTAGASSFTRLESPPDMFRAAEIAGYMTLPGEAEPMSIGQRMISGDLDA